MALIWLEGVTNARRFAAALTLGLLFHPWRPSLYSTGNSHVTDQCLWEYHGAAKQELIEFRKAIARSTNEKVIFLRTLGQVLLDPEIEDAAKRTESFATRP